MKSHKSFPLTDAQEYLKEHESAGYVTSRVLAESKIYSGRRRDLCTQSSGYLFATGFFDGMNTPMCGYVSDQEIASIRAKSAYRELQAVGIVSGFWLVSLLVRRFLLPFLINLIVRQMFANSDEQ